MQRAFFVSQSHVFPWNIKTSQPEKEIPVFRRIPTQNAYYDSVYAELLLENGSEQCVCEYVCMCVWHQNHSYLCLELSQT